MRSIKGGIVILFVLLMVGTVVYDIAVSGAIARHRTIKITLPIVTTGDTARVVKITPILAVMGFTYSDSVDYQADTGAHQTLEWISPQQIMIWTPVADTQGTYKCSVVFQAQTLGFDLVLNEKDTTLATLIDTLVYLFNNTTNLKDTVLAEDSVTYLKLISKIGEGVLKGPWTTVFVITGGSAAMDTASAADSVTIAMVCDSMVAVHIDDAGVDSFMTAYDSSTFYIIQSDDPGVLFHDTNLNHADTHGTWAESQANVTSWSGIGDTVDLERLITDGLYPEINYGGIKLRCYVDSVYNVSVQGVGLADSFYIKLLSGFSVSTDLGAEAWEFRVLANDSFSELPDSLHYALTDASGTDTVMGEILRLVYRVSDSASDSTMSVNHRLYIDYWLFEDK